MQTRPARLLGTVVLLASFTLGWFLIDFHLFKSTPLDIGATALEYKVANGVSMTHLAEDLHRRGVVEHPRYLVWLARWEHKADKIQAGEYALTPGMTPVGLLDKLVSGQVLQHSLTIVEGWTFEQMMTTVASHPKLRHTLKDAPAGEVMAALGAPDRHPEGLFFPDTYHFPQDTSDVTFLRRAYDAMQQTLQAAWQDRDAAVPFDRPYEALIAASIIEKETAVDRERPRIAGVLIRRLKRGMRLAVDPTVIYGLGKDFNGNLRRSDLRRDTPYNTYVHTGLPPTPIAMPGEASLHAALHPDDGDALFFVARGDGSHHFSATLEEHRKAVMKYQLNSVQKQPR